MSHHNFRRRKFFIDKRQYKLVLGGLIYFVAVVLVFVGTVFGPVIIQLQDGSISSPTVQKAAKEFLVLHTRVWAPLFFLLFLLINHSVRSSHRIVGPLYRIRTALRKVGEGKFTERITLRKGDYLMKEAEVINDVIDSLQSKINVLRREVRGADEALDNLRQATRGGSMEELHTRMSELTSHLDVVKTRLDDFDTGETFEPEASEEQPVVSC